MELYLMQHGEAKPEKEDPDRPLTGRGETEVGRVAALAARAGVRIDEARHSGKTRARQTAEILAAALNGRLREVEGLKPKDDPEATRREVEILDGAVALVGHLPHLERLASLLLAGDAERGVVAFRPGGLVALARDEGTWRLRWALVPELAGG